MYGSKRVAVRELNPHILCALCGGYLIQATTVIECLHSFCRSCIVNFLETSKVCPICDAQIHKTRPLLNIRPDQTLQSLVYKLVPGLFQDEMRRRREFHATLSESDLEDLSLEERGEASLEKEFKPGDDHFSLILQLAFRENKTMPFEIRDRRYLLCPSEVTVKHLKKFIRMKFQLNDAYKIEMYRAREKLSDDLMLQDIALIYSWRRERPMNLCYIIYESRRSKSRCWSQQSSLMNKQQTDLSCTLHESSTAVSLEPGLKHPTVSVQQEIASSLTSEMPADCLNQVSKCDVSDSTPVTGTKLSVAIPAAEAAPVSSSIIATTSNAIVKTEPLPSVCTGLGITACKYPDSLSPAANIINSVTMLEPLSIISNPSEEKTSTTTSIACSSVTSPQCASKVKTSTQDASKLMHSVESILKKTPKRASHKTSTSGLSWTPTTELQLLSSGNLCKEKPDKATNKITKHCQQLSEPSQQSPDSVIGTGQEVDIKLVVGVKRSQSVIETSSSVIEVCGQTLHSREVVSSDRSSKLDGLLHSENAFDIYSSYIPKLQKHLKICPVKRSASCEGPSLSPIQGAVACADAMEKRNWKKRKLSTLDFDVSKVTGVDSTNINECNLTVASNGDCTRNSQQEKTLPQDLENDQKLTGFEDSSQRIIQTSVPVRSSGNKFLTSPPTGHSHVHDDRYLSCLLPQGETYSPEKPQLKHSTPDAKVKSSRKTNIVAPTAMSLSTTKSHSRVSCGNRHKDLEKHNKVDKIKIIKYESSKKKSRVVGSDKDITNSYVSTVSPGCIQNKSLNIKHMGTLVEVGSAVEEICVDISTSPSDVSNVTSPTTYVTSPGTEDRTDGSALPDIQTSCDTVVTFTGKVLPLDLSVKKKK